MSYQIVVRLNLTLEYKCLMKCHTQYGCVSYYELILYIEWLILLFSIFYCVFFSSLSQPNLIEEKENWKGMGTSQFDINILDINEHVIHSVYWNPMNDNGFTIEEH